jgi:hypothetical protein
MTNTDNQEGRTYRYKAEIYPFGIRSKIDLTTVQEKDPEKANAVKVFNEALQEKGVVEELGGDVVEGNIGYTGVVTTSKSEFKKVASEARQKSGLRGAAVKFV